MAVTLAFRKVMTKKRREWIHDPICLLTQYLSVWGTVLGGRGWPRLTELSLR